MNASEEFTRDIVTDFTDVGEVDLAENGIMLYMVVYDDRSKTFARYSDISDYFTAQYVQDRIDYTKLNVL